MKKYLYITFLLLIFFSCKKQSLSSNELFGLWEHDDQLHKRISLEFDVPKGNLSGPNAFGEIKMYFDEHTYISYFDNLEYTGVWKIENNLLYMKRDGLEWVGYDYRLNNSELVIFEGQWLMTFIKNSEKNN